MIINNKPELQDSLTTYEIKIFLLITGLLIFLYSFLNILLFQFPTLSIIAALPFYYVSELFFNFYGLFWLNFQYFFFINPILLSFILLIFGFLQVLLIFQNTIYSEHFNAISIVFLLITLTFLPFGLLSIYFLFLLLTKSKFTGNLDEKDFSTRVKSRKKDLALSKIGILVFNYVIAYAFLNVCKAIVSDADFSKYPALIGFLIIALTVSIIVFCVFGLLFIDDKFFIDSSTILSVIAFFTFFTIVLLLNNLYPSIHDQINLLAPFSLFMIINIVFQLLIRKNFKEMQQGEK